MKTRRLLLIAGYFPPVKISVGSIRPWNLAKYLVAKGWDVTVLTPDISIWNPEHLDGADEVTREIRELKFKMLYTGHRVQFLSPDRYKVSKSKSARLWGGIARVFTRSVGISNWYGWKTSAIEACSHLKPEDIDVILATGAPFDGFDIAYSLGKRLNKPYILDYRDLWTRNAYRFKSAEWVIKKEKFLLENSAAVSVVAPSMKISLERQFNIRGKIHVITNGYDPDDFKNFGKKKTGKFKIIYAGTLLPPQRTLAPILKALCLLGVSDENWEFHYFGQDVDKAKQELIQYGLGKKSILHDNIPRKELYSNIKNADLSIVLHLSSSESTREEKGWIPGKVYELIGLQSQMLVITPNSSDLEEVVRTAGFGKCFDADDSENISLYISQMINGKKAFPNCPEKYSWDYLSDKFDDLLQMVI